MSIMHFDPFTNPFRRLDRLTSELGSGWRSPMGMPMDAWKEDDGYHIALDLPGVDPGSVEITSERNMLTIKAERQPEYAGSEDVLVAERPQGSFTKNVQLGEAVDAERIEANYSDGVLRLTLPIAQSAQPRRIQVRSEGSQRPVEISSEAAGSSQSEGSSQDSGSEHSSKAAASRQAGGRALKGAWPPLRVTWP